MIRLSNAIPALMWDRDCPPSALLERPKAMSGARTPACRVGTRANTCSELPKRSHDCERGTQKCVRHNFVIALCLVLSAFVLHAEPADTIYTARYVVTMNARRDLA